jgi:uncharacterized protein YktB (UPF0637 family)
MARSKAGRLKGRVHEGRGRSVGMESMAEQFLPHAAHHLGDVPHTRFTLSPPNVSWLLLDRAGYIKNESFQLGLFTPLNIKNDFAMQQH